MLRAVPMPIIRSSLTVHLALVYVIRFEDSFRAGPGWIPALLESCLQTCMTYTSAKCTVSELLMMGRGTARIM
jgi:metal-sulfur cluster biosynthetic enzyme